MFLVRDIINPPSQPESFSRKHPNILVQTRGAAIEASPPPLLPVASPAHIRPIIMPGLAYTTVQQGDTELAKMESELQAAILSNGYISTEAVKALVQYGIVNCEKFHILGTKDNIPHSQLLLGTSSFVSADDSFANCWLSHLTASAGFELYCIAMSI